LIILLSHIACLFYPYIESTDSVVFVFAVLKGLGWIRLLREI